MSDSLRPHGLQHARPPCPSPTPRVYSNSCLLSQWCHPTISSSVVPFSSCPQEEGSFQMSQLFTSGGQSIGVSASISILPMNIQDWFPLGLTDLISLLSKECSRDFSSITIWKHQFFGSQASLWSNSHILTWLLEKQSFDNTDLPAKWCLCFFYIMSRFVIVFLSRIQRLFILWQSPSTVILEPKKIKSLTVSTFSLSNCEVMGPDSMVLVFQMLSLKVSFPTWEGRNSK